MACGHEGNNSALTLQLEMPRATVTNPHPHSITQSEDDRSPAEVELQEFNELQKANGIKSGQLVSIFWVFFKFSELNILSNHKQKECQTQFHFTKAIKNPYELD